LVTLTLIAAALWAPAGWTGFGFTDMSVCGPGDITASDSSSNGSTSKSGIATIEGSPTKGPVIQMVLSTNASETPHYNTILQPIRTSEITPLLATAGKKQLHVAVFCFWDENAHPILAELDILLNIMSAAFGVPVVEAPGNVWPDAQRNMSEIILIGPYRGRGACSLEGQLAFCKKHYTSKLLVWLAPENTDRTDNQDQAVHEVHVSLGVQRRTEYPITNYMRMPWWIPSSIDKSKHCTFLPSLLVNNHTDPVRTASEWHQRPGFAALLSSHDRYPRPQLFKLFNHSGFGRVDAPGHYIHNMEWPKHIKNSYLDGKVEFLRSYRYNICPENTKSRDNGYNTEKTPQALMSGTVPVYWGDTPLDPEVFNSRRILQYLDDDDRSVLDVVSSLEQNEAVRIQWFSQPILQITAVGWLNSWCHGATALLAEKFLEVLIVNGTGKP
jgi:hypothetical protein